MNYEKIKNSLYKLAPCLGGVALFSLLFVYGLIKNMSMSYMGNTNKQMEDYILNNFLGSIIFYLLKIFAAYILIGIFISIISYFIAISVQGLLDKNLSRRNSFILNLLISGFVFIIFFFKDLILYPQVYINNFYVRNDINKFIVDFLCDNVSPAFFTFIQIIIGLVVIFFILLNLIKILKKADKKVLKQIYYFTAGIIFIACILFIDFKSIFSKSYKNEKPNILILASDALRPDHFSGYGYFRNTTPNIDSLINQGVSFKNTFIEVPRTFPSWVSTLTGRYASTHGIRHMFPTSRDLNRNFRSMATELKQQGYETSVIADYAGDIFSRIDLGFDTVDAPYFNFNLLLEQIILDAHSALFPFITGKAGLKIFPVLKDSAYFCPPELVKDRIINKIKDSKKPFFITTFFSSTHFPYSSPYPYYRLYSGKDYSGPHKYFKQRILAFDGDGESRKMPAEDIEQTRALYDGGLKALDDAIGEVLAYLSNKGILDNTMIVVLSDHGENLYEGDLGMGHGEHFRGQYTIRIPFIIKYPGITKTKKEITETVRHIDVAPTILAALNQPIPEYMEGVSLMPLIKGSSNNIKKLYAFGETGIWFDNSLKEDLFFQKLRIMYPDITILSEVDMHFDKQIALKDDYRDIINLAKHRYVFDGRYKLIYMPLKDKVLYELYDTLLDPEERKNIAYVDADSFSRLKKLLFGWISRNNDVVIKKDYVFPILRY
ncbi:MAG: sulfatase [Spirochaetota bacterium]